MQYDSLPGDDPAEVAEQLAREEDRRRRQAREEEREEERERFPEQDAVQAQYPQEHAEECCLNKALCNEFEHQAERLAKRAKARREAVQLKSVILDREARDQVNEEDMLGRRQPQDEFQGDVNMRTLRALLKMIDERGFERSPHQIKVHSAFERSTARIIYRDDWGTQRPSIMRKKGWAACSSEVLISTPRRFGKTFRYATTYSHAQPWPLLSPP